MGTNDSSSTQAQFKAYDEMYMNAILDMGGYVILGSYTPSGNYGATEGKVYDVDTMTFKGKRANVYEFAIRELYEENEGNPKILGFLDIGLTADDKMTADVKAAYNERTATRPRNARQRMLKRRNFWARGYFANTVGKNEKLIREYIRNQLEDDCATDQISIEEYMDPFAGKPRKG